MKYLATCTDLPRMHFLSSSLRDSLYSHHVERCSNHGHGFVILCHARLAEVGDLDSIGVSDKTIVRLDVSMDDVLNLWRGVKRVKTSRLGRSATAARKDFKMPRNRSAHATINDYLDLVLDVEEGDAVQVVDASGHVLGPLEQRVVPRAIWLQAIGCAAVLAKLKNEGHELPLPTSPDHEDYVLVSQVTHQDDLFPETGEVLRVDGAHRLDSDFLAPVVSEEDLAKAEQIK